jgi:cytochrome bd-type quinol oxidase subunit 2
MSVETPPRTEPAAFTVSRSTRRIAGILLLIMVSVEFGGYFLVQVDTGKVPQTQFQESFAKAGHAHAGVLLILGLLTLILTDSMRLTSWFGALTRLAIPAAAVLISAGFFLSALGADRTTPNPLIVLLWIGVAALTAGLVSVGVALLRR